MIPSFFISSDFITVVCDNRPHTIYSSDARFVQLKDAIKLRAWDEISKIVSLPKCIALFSKGKVKVFDGIVMYNGKEVHNTLTARILEFCREGFPFEPLTCFMDKLMENPSDRSKEQVYQFMEANKLPVTEDGDVIFFKVVTKDFKDCHTRKIDNSIGQIVKMDRALVDDNPHSACSSGLHCASWSYCETFGGTDSVVLLVKVNPKNIVSVPADYNASKVRVCEYEVVKVVGEKNKVVDFDSNLAAKNKVVEKPYIDPTVIEKSIDDGEGIRDCKCGCQDEDEDDNYAEGSAQVEDDKIFQESTAQDQVIKEQFAKSGAPKMKTPIGQNPAYSAHKNGLDVYSITLGLVTPQPLRTRSFFRQVKDWTI